MGDDFGIIISFTTEDGEFSSVVMEKGLSPRLLKTIGDVATFFLEGVSIPMSFSIVGLGVFI